MSLRGRFTALSTWVSEFVGTPWAFAGACGATLLWLVTGPLLGFSAAWNFLANTSTTVLTFLMVFIIQGSQNHNDRAIQIKLDELVSKLEGPRSALAGIERDNSVDLEHVDEDARG